MASSAQKSWLTTVIMGTLMVAVGSFLPWISVDGSTSANAFRTSATLFGTVSPNWLILAACVLAAVYALLQVEGIAEATSKVPVVLLTLAFLQTALLVGTTLLGTPSQHQEVHVDGLPAEFSQSASQMFSSPDPITVHIGIGVVLVLGCTIWLLLSAMRHLMVSKTIVHAPASSVADQS